MQLLRVDYLIMTVLSVLQQYK